MKKLLIILGIAFASIGNLMAQQEGQFSQYMLNYYILNPAISGTEDFIDIKVGGRFQWVGFAGAPTNYYLTAHMPIGKIHEKLRRGKKTVKPHSSIGIAFNGQSIGDMNRNGIYASYAYLVPITQDFMVSMSLQPGLLLWGINQGNVNFGDNVSDNALTGFSNQAKFDLNAGVWAYSKTFFVGFSVAQIMGDPRSINGGLLAGMDRHYFLTTGFKIKMGEELVLIPSVLAKSLIPSTVQVDINAKLKYQNKYWGGVSYRHNDGVVLLAGLLLGNMFEIGYSYDIMTSNLSQFAGGSHEVVLGLRLQPKVQMICPSDFW